MSPPAVVTVQLDHVEPGMGRQPPVDAETKVRQVMKAMDERSKQTVVAVLGPYKHLTPWGNLTWHERFERLQGFGHISHELAAIPNDEEAEEAVQKAMTAIDDEAKARLMSRVGWDAFSAAERWTCLYMEWLIIIPDPPPMLQAFGHQRSQESEEEMPDRYCYDCDDCTSCCKSWYEDIDRTEVVASFLGWLICSLRYCRSLLVSSASGGARGIAGCPRSCRRHRRLAAISSWHVCAAVAAASTGSARGGGHPFARGARLHTNRVVALRVGSLWLRWNGCLCVCSSDCLGGGSLRPRLSASVRRVTCNFKLGFNQSSHPCGLFRPKVSRALRESSATRPERSTDRLPVNLRFPRN